MRFEFRDLSGAFSPMVDFDFYPGSWRIFVRNRYLWHAYAFHKYGFYAFGAFLLGVMVWPTPPSEGEKK